ncbi:esterase [Flammeovirgaceae bacterium 311]|nr:esterase [Flammeovirgaceae bacterium 311]
MIVITNYPGKAFRHGRLITKLLIFMLLPLSTIYAQQQETIPALPKVEIANSEVQTLTSAASGQEYKLFMHLPANYRATGKKYPVLYLLDAQWDFPLVSAIYGEQYYDGFIPEMIIVGITWGGSNPDYDKLRMNDLSPSAISEVPGTGQGERFLQFIRSELMPFVEQTYPASKNDRTLMGSSMGGLFTLYALFTDTELFDRYILTSPASSWDNGVIYTHEKAHAARSENLPVRLYMAHGELEGNLDGFHKLIAQLESRNYKGLQMKTKILEGIGHSGTKAEGYTRGLQHVYAKPALSLKSEILDQYVGTYRTSQGQNINIASENNQLILIYPNNFKQILLAETDHNFYIKGQFMQLEFKKEAGRVSGLQVQGFSGGEFLKKVN